MIKIRNGVFETNSSSTHSLVVMTKDKYDEWVKGDIVYKDIYGTHPGHRSTLMTKDEAVKELRKTMSDHEKFTDDELLNHCMSPFTCKEGYDKLFCHLDQLDLSTFTHNGKEYVVFGYYGRD